MKSEGDRDEHASRPDADADNDDNVPSMDHTPVRALPKTAHPFQLTGP